MERLRRKSKFETPQIPEGFNIKETLNIDYEPNKGIGKFILYKDGTLIFGDFSQQHKALDITHCGVQSDQSDILGAGKFSTQLEEFDFENNEINWIQKFNITGWTSTGFGVETPEELTGTITELLKEQIEK